jgi:DNA-binding HxlR family transcriptional regulator
MPRLRGWSFPNLYRLIIGDTRCTPAVPSAIGCIAQSGPTKYLREFEEPGLLARTVYARVMPPVEYQIADHGKSFRTPLATPARWSIRHGEPFSGARWEGQVARRHIVIFDDAGWCTVEAQRDTHLGRQSRVRRSCRSAWTGVRSWARSGELLSEPGSELVGFGLKCCESPLVPPATRRDRHLATRCRRPGYGEADGRELE